MSCLALVFSSLYGAALANSNSLSNAKSWVEECKKASNTCSLGKVCSTPKMLNSSNSDGSWFIFTPEISGMVSIESTQNENDEAYFAVYGDSCLSPIPNEDGQGTSFYAEMDKEYRIFATSSFIVNLIEYEYCSSAKPIKTLPFSYNVQTKGYPYVTSKCINKKAHGVWFTIGGFNGEISIVLNDASSSGLGATTLLEIYERCNSTVPESCIDYIERYASNTAMIFNASSENTYYIFAGSPKSGVRETNFTVTIDYYDNEQCEEGTLITELPCTLSGTTGEKYSLVTCEEGVYIQRKGSWYRYVHNDWREWMVSVSICKDRIDMFNPKIEVYSSCDENTCVGEGSYSSLSGCSKALFYGVPGKEYNIFITDEDISGSGGKFYVDFLYVEAQPHENCNKPELQLILPFAMIRHTVGSVPSWDECSGGYRPGYCTAVVGNGKTYYATTKGDQTSFETSISVCQQGGISNFTCVAYNESSAYSVDTSVSWKAENCSLYYVFVSSHKNDTGIFTLKVFEAESPVSSNCSSPIFVHELPSVKNASTMYANHSRSLYHSSTLRRGIWYAVPGRSHWIHLNTCSPITDFNTTIEVYLGCDSKMNGGIARIPVSRDGSCGSKDIASFRASKGKLYLIYITASDGAIPDTGFYSLNITSGEYFHELSKPIAFYVFVGYAILFAFFSCIGIVVAIISFIIACVKKHSVDYLKIIN